MGPLDEPLRDQTIARWTAANPEIDSETMELVAQVKRVSALLEASVETVYADSPLTPSEVELLVPLRHIDEPITAIRLSERLRMSRAGVSKALANLEKRGFIARTKHPTDGRSSLISVTELGQEAIDDVFPRELSAHAAVLAGLGGDRSRQIRNLMELGDKLEGAFEQLLSDDRGADETRQATSRG